MQAWKVNSFRLCFNNGEFAYPYRTKGRNPLTAHNCYPLSTYKQCLLFTVRELKQIFPALRKPYSHCFQSSSYIGARCCERNILNFSSLLLLHKVQMCQNVKRQRSRYIDCKCMQLVSYHCLINPYPTAFPYGNGMVLHFY